jgi:hypothetical protein
MIFFSVQLPYGFYLNLPREKLVENVTIKNDLVLEILISDKNQWRLFSKMLSSILEAFKMIKVISKNVFVLRFWII